MQHTYCIPVPDGYNFNLNCIIHILQSQNCQCESEKIIILCVGFSVDFNKCAIKSACMFVWADKKPCKQMWQHWVCIHLCIFLYCPCQQVALLQENWRKTDGLRSDHIRYEAMAVTDALWMSLYFWEFILCQIFILHVIVPYFNQVTYFLPDKMSQPFLLCKSLRNRFIQSSSVNVWTLYKFF